MLLLAAAPALAGDVLVDAEERAAALATAPMAVRRALCGPPWPIGPLGPPVLRLDVAGDGPNSVAAARFTEAVGQLVAMRLGLGDRDAGRRATASLAAWAAADALAPPRARAVPEATRLFHLRANLNALIPAWAILRRLDAPAGSDAIDRWIDARVALIDRDTGPPRWRGRCAVGAGSDCNNHGYLRAAVVAAHGALRGDEAAIRRGLDRLRIAVGQARADGGLPLELARGAKAAWYQRNAAASLAMIAVIGDRAGMAPLAEPGLRSGLSAILGHSMRLTPNDPALALTAAHLGLRPPSGPPKRFDRLGGGMLGCFYAPIRR